MLITMLKPDFEFSNETGLLVQLVHEGWSQINVLVSKANSTRGGHFHKVKQRSILYSKRKNEIIIRDRNGKRRVYIERRRYVFDFPLSEAYFFLHRGYRNGVHVRYLGREGRREQRYL